MSTGQDWEQPKNAQESLIAQYHDFFIFEYSTRKMHRCQDLARNTGMKDRFWKLGVLRYFAALCQSLPASNEYLHRFVNHVYKTCLAGVEYTRGGDVFWTKCLGVLSKLYFDILPDGDYKDMWRGVARMWYHKILQRVPFSGRYTYHMATLQSDDMMEFVYYLCKSSIMRDASMFGLEVLQELMGNLIKITHDVSGPPSLCFLKAHATLYKARKIGRFQGLLHAYLSQLHRSDYWVSYGVQSVVINTTMLKSCELENEYYPAEVGRCARRICSETFKWALALTNASTLPVMHVMLAFYWSLALCEPSHYLLDDVPWMMLSSRLNGLVKADSRHFRSRILLPWMCKMKGRVPEINGVHFPFPQHAQPLDEDLRMRGISWASECFPEYWFMNRKTDQDSNRWDEEHQARHRLDRILWLGLRFAKLQSVRPFQPL